MLANARDDLFLLATHVDLEQQQFVGVWMRPRGKDTRDPQVKLCKVFVFDLFGHVGARWGWQSSR
jgi:hypothetical protein